MTSNAARANPGNFANRDTSQVSEIGRRGGENSHQQDVRHMDADSLVGITLALIQDCGM